MHLRLVGVIAAALAVGAVAWPHAVQAAVDQDYAGREADWPIAPRFNPSRRWYARLWLVSSTRRIPS
jgi:hypothetical protein